MAYVITEPCIGTCDTSCVKVCPVDCIHVDTRVQEGKSLKKLTEVEIGNMTEQERRQVASKHRLQLFIDPEVCIDCAACEPECPVDAIFEADRVPDKWHHYIQMNADYFKK